MSKLATCILLAAMPAVAALTTATVLAQDFPSRPITVISTFAPGTPQDLIVRTMTEIAAKDLRQPIIVEPKSGAAGALTGTAVKNAKPDGYTIGVTTTAALAVTPQMLKVAYDPLAEFTHLMQVGTFPVGIAIKADNPLKTWADVVAAAKTAPGKITYGTPGQGSFANLGMQRVLAHSGVSLTHVPHQGVAGIITALLGGHLALQVTGTEWKPHVEAGTMRLLAMGTGARHPSFKDVPTLRELGYDFDIDVSFGLIGPAGMDSSVVKRLQDAFKAALEAKQVQDLLLKYDIIPDYMNGADFKARVAQITAGMRPVIERLGLAKKD